MGNDNDQEIIAASNSVVAKHNLTENEVKEMIKDNNDLPLLREAYDDGVLQITVNNAFAADKQETAVILIPTGQKSRVLHSKTSGNCSPINTSPSSW